MDNTIFEDLFVLEMSNNHWGNIEKGKKIISEFSKVVILENIKAAIKLQIRDGKNFVHKNYINRDDILYVKKVRNSIMTKDKYNILINNIIESGCIAMATPFDEVSVNMCGEMSTQIIKIASACINEKGLVEKISKLKKPVIVSTGGASLKDIDNIVEYFEDLNIPIAINHCVSVYPTEKKDLNLNQIDFLKKRYNKHVIGFSTHEYNKDIEIPMYIAYSKGARTFERHVDIECEKVKPFVYCSSTDDIKRWINAYKTAKEICGCNSNHIREYSDYEINYIQSMRRGVWAKKDINIGEQLTEDNVYYAIPAQNGQLTTNNINEKIICNCNITKDSAIMLNQIN